MTHTRLLLTVSPSSRLGAVELAEAALEIMPDTSVKSLVSYYSQRRKKAASDNVKDGDESELGALEESYDEYVPLKVRRRMEEERRAGKLGKNRRDKERELLEKERYG